MPTFKKHSINIERDLLGLENLVLVDYSFPFTYDLDSVYSVSLA